MGGVIIYTFLKTTYLSSLHAKFQVILITSNFGDFEGTPRRLELGVVNDVIQNISRKEGAVFTTVAVAALLPGIMFVDVHSCSTSAVVSTN